MKKERGFSLIELLIVVAVISLIAAIAIPNLQSARQAANSASAVHSLRTITTAQQLYKNKYQKFGTIAEIAPEGTIDPHLASGTKSHYTFTISVVLPTSGDPSYHFTSNADPVDNPSKFVHYFVDDTGVIRYMIGDVATTASDPIPK